MPHSKADAATPAPDAGTPGAEPKDRARPDRRASAGAPAPPNGITITRRGLGISLTEPSRCFCRGRPAPLASQG